MNAMTGIQLFLYQRIPSRVKEPCHAHPGAGYVEFDRVDRLEMFS